MREPAAGILYRWAISRPQCDPGFALDEASRSPGQDHAVSPGDDLRATVLRGERVEGQHRHHPEIVEVEGILYYEDRVSGKRAAMHRARSLIDLVEVADLRQQPPHLDIAPGGHQQSLQQTFRIRKTLQSYPFPGVIEQRLPGRLGVILSTGLFETF